MTGKDMSPRGQRLDEVVAAIENLAVVATRPGYDPNGREDARERLRVALQSYIDIEKGIPG